jgi:hypothetical protein
MFDLNDVAAERILCPNPVYVSQVETLQTQTKAETAHRNCRVFPLIDLS